MEKMFCAKLGIKEGKVFEFRGNNYMYSNGFVLKGGKECEGDSFTHSYTYNWRVNGTDFTGAACCTADEILRMIDNANEIKTEKWYTSLNEIQVKLFEALYLLGYRWVAKDEDCSVYVYETKPTKGLYPDCRCGEWDIEGFNKAELYNRIFSEINKLCNWEDKEPLNIEQALKYRGSKVVEGVTSNE